MTALYIILYVVGLLLLLMVAGVQPRRAPLGRFELTRRGQKGDARAATMLQRENRLHDILSLQRTLGAVLLVIVTVLSILAFNWTLGIIISLIVALEFGVVARIPLFRQPAQRLYERLELSLLQFIERTPVLFAAIRSVTPAAQEKVLDSKEELRHLVAQSGDILSHDEKQTIVATLAFDSREVKEIMTPRGMIDSIGENELLGPLVLDDLHKTGHSRFPVVNGDIDHVVGMLHVQDLLSLDKKRSLTAEKTMEPRVYYIREDQTLQRALAAFLRTHHHLFVVVNEFRETVGLLSLEDVVEALLGRKIVDEFDAHDDLRAVASRNPRGNNHPETSEDV